MRGFVRIGRCFVMAAAAAGCCAAAVFAADNRTPVVDVGPAPFQPTAPPKAAPKASDLSLSAQRLPASARHDLGELTAAERESLREPDRRTGPGFRPKKAAVKNGITRSLPGPVGFTGLPSLATGESRAESGGFLERLADGTLVWTASFSSAGAGALRLYLSQARLPPGSRVYVYGDDGEIKGPYDFASGTRPEGFWTNTVYSGSISIEVRIPASSAADLSGATLRVGGVVHVVKSGGAAFLPKDDSCFVDRSCVTLADWPNLVQAGNAVAQLTFVDQGSSFICSGGLLNTTAGPTTPYLLTANHCFDNQSAATSLEAVWQYRTATCNGPTPDESLFPTTLGSTLLATGAEPTKSDYTFLQLSEDPPPNSYALGWTTADVRNAAGLVLYRLSYPIAANMFDIDPQIFTRELITPIPSDEACAEAPTDSFIYEQDIEGGTGGGSSGSPAMLEDLRVVGQLFGACGTNQNDDCDNVNNNSVDGAFSSTFPAVKQWLAPASFGSCVPNGTTLCLENSRFRVTAFWTKTDNSAGAGNAVSLSGDSGYFWFFSSTNIEMIVKVLDGCSLNSNFWVFAGGLTNVDVMMLVEDTVTGASQVYLNTQGQPFQPLQDTQAFVCP